MDKLSGVFKGLMEKWKGLTRNKKIAISIFLVGIIAAVAFFSVSLGSTKYAPLFSNLDATDSAAIYKKLQESKVDAKVSGNSILVPTGQVDQLRLQMMADVPMTNGSQGFELLDKTSFGTTDTQMKINYQRSLQGELERTIKAFPEVDSARVHLVLPEDTAFVKDTQAGTASVTLKLKTGQKLNQEQVKSVVALISGAVKNIPKENVQVIDDKMTLLSKDLFQDKKDLADVSTSAEKQQDLKGQYEKDVQKSLLTMLEAVYGKDKVKVTINADLDFDAVQQDATTYDPKSVVVSEHNIKDNTGGAQNQASNSPVDNNMTNSANTTNSNGNSTHEETTKNYNVSKVEQKTIKAPGAVKRLTASIALDGNIDDNTKNSIRNLAVSAIGYDEKRGDTISVEGLPFDTTLKDSAKKDLDAMNKAADAEKKAKLYKIIGMVAGGVILAVLAFVLLRRKRSEDEDIFDDEISHRGIDVVIGDEGDTKEQPKFKSLDLDVEDEKSHYENEIKKYAQDKPDQVTDIVKAWLAEDER